MSLITKKLESIIHSEIKKFLEGESNAGKINLQRTIDSVTKIYNREAGATVNRDGLVQWCVWQYLIDCYIKLEAKKRA